MAHNLLTKAELGFFYENRKKLDSAIGEILGPGIHLHQFSQSSDRSADISSNSYGLRNPQANKNSNVHSVNSGGNKKSQKNTNDLLSHLNSNSNEKMQKLSKQNMELQKKLIKIKDENIEYKHKSGLWQKIKSYIINNLSKQLKLNSVQFGSSDAAVLDQLISCLAKIVDQKQTQPVQKNNTIHQMENNDQIKNKLQQEYKQVSKLRSEIEHLKSENNELKNKQKEIKKYWRTRLEQSQQKSDDQLNNLKTQTQSLNNKVDELTNSTQKMKKVIHLAQNLNNEFMTKLEDELKKSRTTVETQFNEYGQSKRSFQTKRQPEQSFHFANKRFKIVKSRSVQKQRFMYGQKDKDKR